MAEEDGGEEDLLETTIASRSGLCCGEDGDDGEQVRAEEEDATACGGVRRRSGGLIRVNYFLGFVLIRFRFGLV